MKKIYLVESETYAWDEFDSVVIVADNEEEALSIAIDKRFFNESQGAITATEVDLTKSGVVLSSFNAG